MVGDRKASEAPSSIRLEELTLRVSKCDPRKEPTTTFQYVDISAIDQVGKQIVKMIDVRGRDAPSRARQVLQVGDVLVSTVRPNLNSVARVGAKHGSCIASTGFCVLRPRTSELDSRYLINWVRTPQFVEEMVQQASGASYPAISDKIVKDSLMPLPPIEEQRRIAAVLDAVDVLRAKRRQALAKLDTLTQAIFIDMFGDPARNERGWRTATVRDVCDLVRGSSPRPRADPRYYGGPVPRLMVADVTRDGLLVTPKIDSLTVAGAKMSRSVPAGTVVMAVSGNVGLVSQLAVNACVHDGFVAFKNVASSTIRPRFLLWQLHLGKASHQRNTAGAIFQNLTTKDIKELNIIAPTLSEQDAFLIRAEAVADRQAESLRHDGLIADLFASLQQRAFRGEL